jgi:hypothetical protein
MPAGGGWGCDSVSALFDEPFAVGVPWVSLDVIQDRFAACAP